jgi:glycerate kinase
MRVLVAPDKFKGSLDAFEAAGAMANGVCRAVPGARVDLCPLSDGGEGFESVLRGVLGGAVHEAVVTGLDGTKTPATFTLLPDGTAVIESARVIGLALVSPGASDPVEARRTDGLGELVLAALDAGAERIAIGLGGTATMDAGTGLARALGVELTDTAGVQRVDVSGLDPRISRTPILVLTDVDNPLLGESGAPRTFGPQKGASPGDIARIEAGFRRFTAAMGDAGDHPGDGAAGGLGYALRVLAGARRRRGIDHVLDAVRFDERLDEIALVLTGEGKLDAQTAQGKVVSGVVARCAARRIPVVALAGTLDGDLSPLFSAGLTDAHAIAGGTTSVAEAMTNAARLLEELTERTMRDLASRHIG